MAARGASDSGASTVARAQVARENEELVLAEASLRAQRVVAYARVLGFFFMVCAMALIPALVVASYLATEIYIGREDLRGMAFVCGIYLTMGLLLGLLNARMRSMFVELRRRDNLSRFLAPEIAERVMRQGDDALAPVQREV